MAEPNRLPRHARSPLTAGGLVSSPRKVRRRALRESQGVAPPGASVPCRAVNCSLCKQGPRCRRERPALATEWAARDMNHAHAATPPNRSPCGSLTGSIGSARPSLWWRDRKLQHLRNRVAMNAKPICRLPAAQPVHQHRASYPGIELHCEHPSSPPIHAHVLRQARQAREGAPN